MKRIEMEEVDDGYQYSIEGHHKYNGKRVSPNDRLEVMLERIGETVLGYKVKLERR